MKADLSDEQRATVAKRIVALASQMAPGCEGEALHSAVMYWLDEEVISEDDPDIAKVNEGLGRLSGKMQALGGVPGRTKGQPAPNHETLYTEEEAVSILRYLIMRRTEQVLEAIGRYPKGPLADELRHVVAKWAKLYWGAP